MSYANAVPACNVSVSSSSPSGSAKVLMAALSALLMAAALLFSGRAAADPAAANRVMQVIAVDRQVLDMNIQLAKQMARTGDLNAARSAFLSAQMHATMLNMDLVRLHQENQDSLDRGLYRDRAALERAIQHGRVAEMNMQVVSMDLQLLVQQPGSVQFQARLDLDMVMFNTEMTQLERAMRDA
ncbi:MAG: hypothetical protein ACREP7_08900 [Lysobacter sp.]